MKIAYNKDKKSLLIILFLTVNIASTANSHPFIDFLTAYNPFIAGKQRIIFGTCLLKALYNTLRGDTQVPGNGSFPDSQDPACIAQALFNQVRTNNYISPHAFLWGAGTSAHQVEGYCHPSSCSWSRWENQQITKATEPAGKACDH